ncbi:MAG TPA: MBL fold metallo-hydrolase [Gammaproteobacteria bacterium]
MRLERPRTPSTASGKAPIIPARRSAAVLAAWLLAAHAASAQEHPIEIFHVQGNVHMLVGAGANIAVQTGDEGVLVVDTGLSERRDDVLAAIRRLSDKPIRWIVNTHAHADHTGGNEALSQAGMTVNGNPAAIIAHERVLARMSDAGRPITELPLNTFFEPRRDFYFNGEAIFLYHVPAAHTDGDVIVYFRGSDVLVAGDLFVTTHYPVVDLEAGGGIDGFIQGLNTMLDIAVPAYLQEGGTYVIPGHGRVGDEADVVEYRDMVQIIRDRVQSLVEQGAGLDEVLAAKPTLDYDPRYGHPDNGWTTEAFVEAVYRDLVNRRSATQ